MTGAQAYASTLFPPHVSITGVRLLPLQIGHVFLLEKLGSPFLPQHEAIEPQLADLALGMSICSKEWQHAARVFRSRWFRWMVVLRSSWIEFTRRKEEGIINFMVYIHASTKLPPIWIKEDTGNQKSEPTNVGFWHGLKMTLQSRLHMSHDDVMSLPVCRAIWEYTAQCANEGRIQFMSDAQREIEARNAERPPMTREQLIAMAEAIERGAK